MDIKDSYLHGTVGVVKSISVAADKLSYKLADVAGTTKTVTMPTATQSANGLLSSTDKKKLDSITGPTLSIPYIVGPDTDTTKGTWTGSYSGITAYTDGLTIIYVPKVAGASTTTLNINGLGAKTCHYTGSSNLTTHYSVGTPILLTYVGGYWKRADYDSWTPYVAAYCSTAAATAAKTASCSSYVLTSKTYIHMLITTANTAQSALTMNINSKGAKPIYINGAASSSSNYTLPAGTYIVYYDGTNFYFRTDGVLPGTIEKATNATSASKVANNLILKIKSGSTENTDLYTYNGSSAKTLDIKLGSNITLTAGANSLTIAASDTKVTLTNTTASADYRVLLSGNANDTTETTTARKSTYLHFNPSTKLLKSHYIVTKGMLSDAVNSLEDLSKSGNYLSYSRYSKVAFSNETGITISGNANGVLWVGTHGPEGTNTSEIGYGHMLGFTGGTGGLYHKVIPNGDTTGSWRKIAYTHSDITGNAASADKLKTKRKLWGLDFDGTADVSGNMTGVGVINKVFKVTSTQDIAQLNVSEESSTVNYSHLYVSSNNTSNTNSRPLVLQYGYGNVGIGVIAPTQKLEVNGNVKATSFIGNIDGTYVNKLTGYSKATAAANLATTDTLNAALGKLEYKAHYAYDWVIGVTKTDTDEYINKWSEIVGFLDSVKEGTDILDEFVTRKTKLTITGAKTFNNQIVLNVEGNALSLRSSKLYCSIDFSMTNDSGNTIWSYLVLRGDARFVIANSGWTKEYTLLHEGNSHIKNGVITINGTSITPLTSHQSLANYVTLNTALTISGVKTFSTLLKFTVAQGTAPFTVTSTTKVANLNADLLDDYHETSFLRYRGGIDVAYVDLTDTTSGHASFKKPSPGMYTIGRSGYSDMFISFAMNSGSCSSLEFKVAYSNTSRLAIRKVVDSNRISGTWKELAFTSDIPTSLKNPYTLTFSAGTFAAKTYNGSAAVTVNVPTKTSHLTNDSGYLTSRGYIGTTAVQASSAALALTGITNLTMSGNLTITPGNTDNFINFSYNSGTTYSWRLGYLGTGSGDTNYFVVQSAKAAGTSWNNVIRLGNETLDAAFGGNVYPLVNNSKTLGTSSLRWSNIYSVSGNYSGNITLYKSDGGDSPHLVFLRGTTSDGSYDWRIYDTGGSLKFQYCNADAWTEILSLYSNGITSTAFIKSGSSDSYVLLGGGGHKTISSLSVASANKLNSTTVISAKAFSLSNASWTDTGYTFASLASGTYAVQVTSGTNLVASGIMSVYKNLSDTAGDEIPLHVYGTAGWRPYLRTYANKLLISSNDTSSTKRTVTIKIALIL